MATASSPSQAATFLASLKQGLSITPSDVVQFLEASEHDLILTMAGNHCWTGTVPPPPATRLKGDACFGLVPYFINNPPQPLLHLIDSLPHWVQEIVEALLAVLQRDVPTHIDKTNFDALIAYVTRYRALIGDDGSFYGLGVYECLDFNWLWAVINHLYTRKVGNYPYSPAVPPVIALDDGGSGQLTIAMLSDWGTGPYAVGSDSQGPALDVIEQLRGLGHDYLIHLGDVYYAGTPNSDDLKDLLYFPWHEERDNFLNYWPATQELPPGRSFALNSNHEMYSGGEGYFKVALRDPRFGEQRDSQTGEAASFFALTYGDWTILALDSAYYDPSPMCMTGSLGGAANTQQADWIRGLVQAKACDPARCIVLTHHAPIKYDGSGLECYKDSAGNHYCLWTEVTNALGTPPAYWYYGHIHNGIVYNPSNPLTGGKSLLRCLGNGALPYGNAWGLQNAPAGIIDFYYHTPNPSEPSGLILYNGFVLLTLTRNGPVQERFYQQGPRGGTPTIVYPPITSG